MYSYIKWHVRDQDARSLFVRFLRFYSFARGLVVAGNFCEAKQSVGIYTLIHACIS